MNVKRRFCLRGVYFRLFYYSIYEFKFTNRVICIHPPKNYDLA